MPCSNLWNSATVDFLLSLFTSLDTEIRVSGLKGFSFLPRRPSVLGSGVINGGVRILGDGRMMVGADH